MSGTHALVLVFVCCVECRPGRHSRPARPQQFWEALDPGDVGLCTYACTSSCATEQTKVRCPRPPLVRTIACRRAPELDGIEACS